MVTSRLIALSRRLTQFNLAPQALAWRSADFQPIARWAKGDPRCEHSAPVCRRKRELGLWPPVTGAFDREADGETPSRVLMAHKELQRLEAALRTLPPRQELAIRLRNELHLSFHEVAEALDCSQDAAQKLWTRAVKQLGTKFRAGGSVT